MSKSIDAVIREAYALVEPTRSETERANNVAYTLLEQVRGACEEKGLKTECVLGGSLAKGTWLKPEADVDIFVKFPVDSPDTVLEKEGVSLGFQALSDHNPRLRYSEHPYVEGFFEGVRVNVVPCFDTPRGEWRSAADRSPYHTDYISKAYDDGLRREARLFKLFLKSLGIYGAEVKTQGFSGYVAEILTLKYESFKNLLSEASKFKSRMLISIGEVQEDFFEAHKSPLVILDPVDLRRNIGAAISQENVGLFTLASRLFLKNPSLHYFALPKKHLKTALRTPLIDQMVVVLFSYEPRSPDILWGQMRRSADHLRRQLNSKGFKIIRFGCASNEQTKGAFLFLVDEMNLPSRMVRTGPFYHLDSYSDKFVSINSRKADLLWLGEEGRIYGVIKRESNSVQGALRKCLGSELRRSGVAPGLVKDLSKGSRIFLGRKCLRLTDRYEWLRIEMVKLVSTHRLAFGVH